MQVVLGVPNRELRLALELYLDEEAGIFMAGAAGEAAGVRALVAAILPDLLIMTWDLPGCSAARFIRETRASEPATQVIVLSSDEGARTEALAAGAAAFVVSWGAASDLLTAIRHCAAYHLSASQPGSQAH